jgi:hypothetical protein
VVVNLLPARLRFIAAIVFLLVLSSILARSVFALGNQEASSTISEADQVVKQAYITVLDAESAGANVTGLLARLNDAAALLAQAEMAYRNANTNTAADKAYNALSIAAGVQTSAVDARDTALVSGQNALWSTVAFSSIGFVALVLVLSLVWRLFKQSYVRRMFEAKPEVSSQ